MDPYAQVAKYYDLEHDEFHDDIDFYLQVIQGGPILEVGAGTGRVTSGLARTGLEIVALDPSPSMLVRASERLEGVDNVRLVRGDISCLDASATFGTILFPLNTLWHLSSQVEQIETLRLAHNLSGPQCLLAIDVTNPVCMADRGALGQVRVRFSRSTSGRCVTGFSSALDDEADQTLRLNFMYDDTAEDGNTRKIQTHMSFRYVYRWELEALLRIAGFRVRSVYGSYGFEPYDAHSPSLIVLAEPLSN
jgi:SAM-dependent methyltransferase